MTKNGNWIEDDKPDMDGKIAFVTGANSGIGYEQARALACKGASVTLACRNETKGETALQQILRENPQAKVELMLLDLSDLSSVCYFAEEYHANYDRLDLLINNAGTFCPHRSPT